MGEPLKGGAKNTPRAPLGGRGVPTEALPLRSPRLCVLNFVPATLRPLMWAPYPSEILFSGLFKVFFR